MVRGFQPSPDINQWLETTMGANTSKVDTDLTGEFDASSARPTPGTLSNQVSAEAASISSDQGSIRTTVTSSVHISSSATSPTSSQRSAQTGITTLRREPMMATSTSKGPTPSTSLLSGSVALEIPTHRRPLPPPESRETIRSQAAKVSGWKIIDASEEIYESCQIDDSARPEIGDGSVARYDTGMKLSDFDTKPTLEEASIVKITIRSSQSPDPSEPDYNVPPTISMLPLAEPPPRSPQPSILSRNVPNSSISFPVTKPKPPITAQSRKRKSSALSEPKKKRRLILTARAIEIADQSVEASDDMDDSVEDKVDAVKKSEFGFVNPFPDGFPLTTAEEEWLLPDAHPGSCLYQDSDHEDEDYWSQIVSTSDPVEGETVEERDERRMKLLARFHDHNPPLKAAEPENESPDALLLKQARELMLKEQEAGAERSRRLREQALRRRGLLPESGSSSSPEHDKTFSDTRSDDSPMTELFSDKDDDMQMEELLDMAQEYATKDGNPARSTFKTQRPQTSLGPSNPASRAAAEQFRTQSRHLRGDNPQPRAPNLSSMSLSESHPPSQDPNLEERERRLREAKRLVPAAYADTGRRVSSPTLGDELARGDFASRTPISLKKSSSNFAADRSPHNRGRHERSVGVGLRPRSLIDRISSYRKVDEEYDDEDDVPSSGGPRDGSYAIPSRPLSGLEVLAAKAHATEGDRHDIKPSTQPLSGLELLATRQEAQASRGRNTVDGRLGDDGDNSFSMTEPGSGASSTFSQQDNRIESLESVATSRLRPVSALQIQLARNNGLRDDDETPTNGPVRRPAFAPASSRAQGTKGLTLPKNFNRLPENEKENIVQHEIAKERQRDLEVLGNVFWDFSQLLCYKNRELSKRLIQTETDELYEIGRFIAIVIDQNKPGKMRRPRIQGISGNIKRRIEKAARNAQQPTDDAILVEMRCTFGSDHVDFMDGEVTRIEEVVRHYGNLRRSKNTRKDSRRRPSIKRDSEHPTPVTKQVRFEIEEEPDLEDFNTNRDFNSPKRLKALKRGGTATENRRQAQYDRQERLAEKYRELLKRFDTADSEQIVDIQTQVAETEEELARLREHEDSESEEEGGADYVYGAGRDAKKSQPDQDINEINLLEDARQKEAGTHFSQRIALDQPAPRQAFDPELLRKMQLKKLREEEAKNDPSIIQDKDAEVADDSDSDSETVVASDDEEEVERQVFKYTVYATFRGVAGYQDADHYLVKGYYDYGQAEKRVLEIIAGIHSQLPRGTVVDPRNWSCNTSVHDGLMEQHLMLGEDVDHEARVWVEKVAVDLDKRRFQQAKRQRAVIERFNYKVYWEKKIAPVVEEVEDVTETSGKATTKVATKPALEPEYEGYEELFGTPSPSPEPEPSHEEQTKSIETIVTEISRDEVDDHTFSSSAWANRDAKNIFLKWFYSFLPGLENEGYRRQEDESMEQYLEELGDWGLFDRLESLKGLEVDERGAERKVEETFRVWVKKVAVKGPGN